MPILRTKKTSMTKFITCIILLSFASFTQAQNSFSITERLSQEGITPTQFTLTQKTDVPSKVIIKYGTTPSFTNTYVSETNLTTHDILIENLEPSTFYYVQVTIETENETLVGETKIMATASNSTGEIRYFFLNGVEESYSNGVLPDGDQYPEVLDAMYELIDNAQITIDVAVYNTSWFEFVDRLEDAVERGVRVRYIHDEDTNNSALQANQDFPILSGSPDDGIMHNKFMIVDADDDLNAHVVTGSMNWTFGNITEDYNNTIIIQDKTLALNYTIEFEEMWGSNGSNPDAGNAKFGDQKTDNTAHNFNIAGVEMECYFSPSDDINNNIEQVVNGAEESLEIAMLLITKEDVTTAIKNRRFAGVDVRGIFDNDETDEFVFLQSNNVNVIYHYPSDMIHHKYAIADANKTDSDPTVLTGSHNWTWSAENINDENTLIIHDADAANLFLQEFEARWDEVGPTAVQDFSALQNAAVFPNPFVNNFQIQLNAKIADRVTTSLVNSLGQKIYSTDNELITGDNTLNFPIENLTNGVYFLTMRDKEGRYILTKTLEKI
ncbi:MAG: phosphatidylserine/phosphatidylglycerophosphate/cardiolipin synthase-like enzyme [Saprospiraceae bacterium]|jgi:phosphatidylserine/phosphatidylglycerophosphate/cardiolipin synthase-like enzyme